MREERGSEAPLSAVPPWAEAGPPGAGRYSLPPPPLPLEDLAAQDATRARVILDLHHYYNDSEECRARGRELEAWARERLDVAAPFVTPRAVGELIPRDESELIPRDIYIDLADPIHRRIGALYAPRQRPGGEIEHTVFLNLYSPHSPEKELNREIFHALWRTGRFSPDDTAVLHAAWPAWSGRGGPRRGQKTVPDAHTPTHMPRHVIEHARRVTEEALFNPPMPPEYREQLERLNREASERKTSPPTRISTGTSTPTP